MPSGKLFYWRLRFYVFYRLPIVGHSFLLRVSPTGFIAEVLTRPLGLSFTAFTYVREEVLFERATERVCNDDNSFDNFSVHDLRFHWKNSDVPSDYQTYLVVLHGGPHPTISTKASGRSLGRGR
jgi:hypothetical protein